MLVLVLASMFDQRQGKKPWLSGYFLHQLDFMQNIKREFIQCQEGCFIILYQKTASYLKLVSNSAKYEECY